MDEELSALKKTRLKYGLLGFLLPPVLLFFMACTGAADGFQYFMFFVEIMLAVFFIGFKFVPYNKKVKNQNAIIQTYLNNLNGKRNSQYCE